MSDKFSKYADDEDKFSKYADDEDEHPQESTGISGVLGDVASGAMQLPFNLAQGLMQLPSEAYGAGKQLLQDRPRFAKNIEAGFGELGHGILSAPGSIRDYLAKKQLISQDTSSFRLPESILPKDYDYGEGVGVEGQQKGDQLIRSIPMQIASTPLAHKLFAAIEEIPLTKRLAARPLEAAKSMVKERGVKNIRLPKEIYREAKDYLPKTKAYGDLLKKAKAGDYNAVFTLQSDIGKLGAALTKSASGAERMHGFETLKFRQRVLEGFKNHLEDTGHKDIAALIGKGQNKYRQHHVIANKLYKPLKKTGVPLGYTALGIMGIKKLLE